LTLRTAAIGAALALSVLVVVPKAIGGTGADPRPTVGRLAGEPFYHLNFPSDLRLDLDLDLEAEDRMLALINQTRFERGLPALVTDPQLQAAARDHSRDMFRRAYFAHETPDRKSPFERIHAAGIAYVMAGENIAYAPDVDEAQTRLMASPPHRANITDADFKRVGIGVYRGAGGYEEMFTQDFADYG